MSLVLLSFLLTVATITAASTSYFALKNNRRMLELRRNIERLFLGTARSKAERAALLLDVSRPQSSLADLAGKITSIEQFQKTVLEKSLSSLVARDSIYESILAELSKLIANTVDHQQDENAIINDISSITNIDDSSLKRIALSKEIAHALKTPLDRIDKLADLISISEPSDIHHYITRIKSAARVCNYYVTAFQSIDAEIKGITHPDSIKLEQIIAETTAIYSDQVDKHLNFNIEMPIKITALPAYYALSVLLPLIENAIEASRNGDTIYIKGKEIDGVFETNIINNYYDTFPSDDIYAEGFTTKAIEKRRNADGSGLGLSIVNNFLAGLSIGDINHTVLNDPVDSVCFSVRMKAGYQ